MSRIGKKPIAIPSGVKVELKGQHVKITGSKGTLEMDVHPLIQVEADDKEIRVINDDTSVREKKQLHGTMRALLANMVEGVNKGYERKMEIYGTGYNVKEQGGKLILTVGYCNAVEVAVPKEISINIEVPATRGDEVPAKFTVSSIDKCAIGQFVSEVRKVRPPEPYKGKGIRFGDEQITRKVGKAFATGG